MPKCFSCALVGLSFPGNMLLPSVVFAYCVTLPSADFESAFKMLNANAEETRMTITPHGVTLESMEKVLAMDKVTLKTPTNIDCEYQRFFDPKMLAMSHVVGKLRPEFDISFNLTMQPIRVRFQLDVHSHFSIWFKPCGKAKE
jgi:hypothetical protein